MTDAQNQSELDRRWDIHSERQLEAARGGIVAVTVLNSGSWVAMLTQADKLASLPSSGGQASNIVLYWGLGAFLGTLTWLFLYLSTLAQARHDFQRGRRQHRIELEIARWAGLLCVSAALGLFVSGVLSLSELVALPVKNPT
jgi:hypothetical protein